MDGSTIAKTAAGLVLLVAGTLKTHELFVGYSIDAHVDRWISVIAVQFEFLLAIWLLSDWRPQLSQKFTCLVFSCFALYSLSLAIGGHASCGCFGKVRVHPWWTLLLDISVVYMLIHYHPSSRQDPGHNNSWVLPPWICLFAVACTLVLGLVLSQTTSTTLSASGDFIGNSNFVLLEPSVWVGDTFPLSNHISDGTDLTKGRWVVLLYHHDCKKCQDALPHYQRLESLGSQVALVEVPPYGDGENASPLNRQLWRRLSEAREWFVSAPVEIVVENGVVASVSDELVSIAGVRLARQ